MLRMYPKTRESRLFKSNGQFVTQAALTMLRAYLMYRPLKTFLTIGLAFFIIGSLPILRFLYFYFAGQGEGHIQSLVLGSMLVLLGFLCVLLALVTDVLSRNRILLNSILYRLKRLESKQGSTFDDDDQHYG